MSKSDVDDRLELDGELGAEARSILANLTDHEVETGMVAPAEQLHVPESSTRSWTVEHVKEVLADAVLERSLSDLLCRARAESSLTLAEIGQRMGVSRARVSQLVKPDANLEMRTLLRICDALGFDIVVALKPRGEGQPIASELQV